MSDKSPAAQGRGPEPASLEPSQPQLLSGRSGVAVSSGPHRESPAHGYPVAGPPELQPPSVKKAALQRISCSGCGRSFLTEEGAAMLSNIAGGCLSCGGSFGLHNTSALDQ
jgi:hypothetical protein